MPSYGETHAHPHFICTAFQLLLVLIALKMIAPSALPWARFFFALFGAQFLILGNWMAKLPPPRLWRPVWLSLSTAGEAAILRLGGRLFVIYGLTVIGSALLMPTKLIAPIVVSLSLVSLVIVGIRRRQIRVQY